MRRAVILLCLKYLNTLPGWGAGYAPNLDSVLEGFGFENVICSTNLRNFNDLFLNRYCFAQIRQQMHLKLCAFISHGNSLDRLQRTTRGV